MKNPIVYVVHGYTASPASHWFPWFAEEMAKRDIKVERLRMPDTNTPKLEPWVNHLHKEIGVPNENTILIAHSLGCIATLKYLASLPEGARLGGLILVAGFSEPLKNLPELDGFTREPYDTSKIIALTPQRTVVISDNDQNVSPAATRRQAQEIEAALHTVPGGGHFMGSEGFMKFPLIIELINSFTR